jgi:uncharacterized protein (TIGR02996 family)
VCDSPLASSEWLALVAAVRFNPAEDTPRLVAADWLEETGRPELVAWAEFVRVQVEGSREQRAGHVFTESCDCGSCRADRRAVRLFDQWSVFWSAASFFGLSDYPITLNALQVGDFERGFLRHLMARSHPYKPATIPKLVSPLFQRQPVSVMTASLCSEGRWPSNVPIAVYLATVRIEPRDGWLAVFGRLHRPENPHLAIRAHRRADTPYQFPRMVRAVLAECLRGRSQLDRLTSDPRRTATPRRVYR